MRRDRSHETRIVTLGRITIGVVTAIHAAAALAFFIGAIVSLVKGEYVGAAVGAMLAGLFVWILTKSSSENGLTNND